MIHKCIRFLVLLNYFLVYKFFFLWFWRSFSSRSSSFTSYHFKAFFFRCCRFVSLFIWLRRVNHDKMPKLKYYICFFFFWVLFTHMHQMKMFHIKLSIRVNGICLSLGQFRLYILLHNFHNDICNTANYFCQFDLLFLFFNL